MGDTVTQVTDAVRSSLQDVVNYLPDLVAAIIVLLVGIIVAWAVKTVIVRGLGFLQVKKYTDAIGLNKVITKDVEVVDLLGDIAKWIVLLTFLVVALDVAQLSGANDILKDLLAFVLADVTRAIVILFIGVVIADLASRVVKATANSIGVKASEILSDIARWSIIVFAFLAALQQLGIAKDLINTLFMGIVALVAIAGGLAFGLGGKDAASEAVNSVKKNMFKK
ncbi:hypothetical protein C4544_05670 [candidate division WS5 bacterium]|uniref:Mechanosensitive ion channel n=1 Tax=candidate division WS5 bacterium TaxID=2093353 RepID=A0A419DAX1_9BACT|nr:MAG: hypothetical protein C4544_05670 [candidate division WS5 bacterium]